MEAQRLSNDAVQVWKAVDKIVISWVSITRIFGHLFAETGLLFGVPRKLDDYPLKRKRKRLDGLVIKIIQFNIDITDCESNFQSEFRLVHSVL